LKLENIPGFLFVFGAAIIVAIIIFTDIYKKKKTTKPFVKWAIVFLLSIWQVGCWRALNNFGTSFGNSSSMAFYEKIFIALVFIWFIFQIVSYLRNKKKIGANV
jgi:hypothetical protein